MRMVKTLIPCCIFIALLVAGILEANTIARFSGISLRYSTPISGQSAFNARQFAIENDSPFWPTFWHECTAVLYVGARTAQVGVISFSGDAMLVWPARYLTGNAPSVIDGYGIAVSKNLAHRLWGSINVIGKRVYVGNTPRIVRGVFEGDRDLALLSLHIENTSQNFTAVELTQTSGSETRESVENFATTSGLGRPNYIIMGWTMSFARFIAIFPLFIPGVYILVLVFRFAKKYYPLAGTSLFFTGLVLLAIMLPTLLNTFSPQLIPTHWSDFSFWSSLVQQASSGLREFLSTNPMLRDIELKMYLIRQTVIFMLAMCCGIVVTVFCQSHTRP